MSLKHGEFPSYRGEDSRDFACAAHSVMKADSTLLAGSFGLLLRLRDQGACVSVRK